MKSKEVIFLAIVTLYIAYLIIPIFMYVSRLNISMVCIVTTISIFVLYPKCFFNKVAYAGLVYLIILFLYYLAGKHLPVFGTGNFPELVRLMMATAFILPNLAITFVMNSLNSKVIYGYVAFSSLVLLLLSFISFTPLIIHDASILRLITTANQNTYIDPRLPHYSLLHSYIMLLPAILLGFKVKKDKWRWFFLFTSLYLVYVILQSSIATTIVLTFMVIIIMLTYNPLMENKSVIRALGLILVALLLIESGVLSLIMENLVSYYEDTASASKMRYFRDLIAGNQIEAGNSMEQRDNLHQMSIDSFIENPLFGGGKEGSHSSLLDRLGAVGLVGFIPYLFFLYIVVITTLHSFINRKSKITFLIVAFCAFTLLYTKGIFGQECWLFFIVLAPVVLHYLELDKHKKWKNHLEY